MLFNVFYYIFLSTGEACVTQSDNIRTLCLEKIVIKNVLTSLHGIRGDVLEENLSNRSHRFEADKQFIWFVFKRPGKRNRLVIPSSVIWMITEKFPQEDGIYIPFE